MNQMYHSKRNRITHRKSPRTIVLGTIDRWLTERSLDQVKLGVVLEKCCLAERQRHGKKWRPAIILKEKEYGIVMNGLGETEYPRHWEMERYRRRGELKGNRWQPGGINMIPTNQNASRVDRDPCNPTCRIPSSADSKLPNSTRRIITQER